MAGRTQRRITLLLGCATWGYAVLVAAACGIMYGWGDRWWPATLLLFGPRWVAAVPLVILVPLALWFNRRLLIPLILVTALVFGPLMGLCLPGRSEPSAMGKTVRVITCNVQGGEFRKPELAELVRDTRADIVALQECPREVESLLPPGWHMVREGALALVSRYPLAFNAKLQSLHPPHKWPRDCLLTATATTPYGEIAVCTVHLPSPRYGLQHVLDRHTGISLARTDLLIRETLHRAETARKVRGAIPAGAAVMVLGDFNMPQESSLYRETWSAYDNAFDKVGSGYGHTERARVGGIPIAVRIDHVLVGPGLIPLVCEVGPDVGSDHLPVIADIAVTGGVKLK